MLIFSIHLTEFVSISSRKRLLELEGNIDPVACLALSPSPVAVNAKGKAKKLKVVRSKKT